MCATRGAQYRGSTAAVRAVDAANRESMNKSCKKTSKTHHPAVEAGGVVRGYRAVRGGTGWFYLPWFGSNLAPGKKHKSGSNFALGISDGRLSHEALALFDSNLPSGSVGLRA